MKRRAVPKQIFVNLRLSDSTDRTEPEWNVQLFKACPSGQVS